MTGDRDDESFLARWSRRKQSEGRRGRDPDKQAVLDERPLPADAAAVPEPGPATEAPVEDDRPLPSLDDLKPDGDLTAFLEKRVPEELRRQAMRRMWTMDPTISTFIEMAENQYDWNVPGGAPLFGDLDPGTDVAALLAQATGALPAPAVPPVETAGAAGPSGDAVAGLTADNSPVTSGSEAPVAAAPVAPEPEEEAEGDRQALAGAREFDPVAEPLVDGDADAQNTGATGSPRRHGGALPV